MIALLSIAFKNAFDTYRYGVFFFQILYSASIKRSWRTSATSEGALAAAAAVPVIVAVVGNDNPEKNQRDERYGGR